MKIYGWEIALGILALALAISFVLGIINKLRGAGSMSETS
jgi:flagellar biosynthesis protein FliR